MKKHDYTKLDAAILDALRRAGDKAVRFASMLDTKSAVRREAEKLEGEVRGKTAAKGDEKPAWRFIDSRLQALRRAGKIRYQRGAPAYGWVLERR